MEMIQYRGGYRFADRAALDRALARALVDHAAWTERFHLIGSSVHITLDVPARRIDQRHAAAEVMQFLALSAIEGIVVARERELAVDVFACGE